MRLGESDGELDEREPGLRGELGELLHSVVYVGHLVEDPGTGEEVEVFEDVPCRRWPKKLGRREYSAGRGILRGVLALCHG